VRLVTCDQTRLVNKVALWNLSGQRSDAGTIASGCGIERIQSNSEMRPVNLLTVGVQVTIGITQMMLNRTPCSASGQFNRHVRSMRKTPSEGVTAIFVCGAINTCGGRPWLVAEHTIALVAYVVVLGSPLTHSCLIVFIRSSG
jgi:hypothetical protein